MPAPGHTPHGRGPASDAGTSTHQRPPHATAREATRRNYQRLLERVLARHFIGAKVDGLRSAMDLEHSFGPAYVPGGCSKAQRRRL